MGWFAKNHKGDRDRPTAEVYTPAAAAPRATSNYYVAPSEPTPVQSPVTQYSVDDQDDVVVVNGGNGNEVFANDSNPQSTFSKTEAEESARDHSYGSAGKGNHLNSLFNGHLMKWKFEAEEGTSFLRIPAFFGAVGLMVTAILSVILYPDAWEPHSIVMTVCVVVLSIFILVLEGRFLTTNPLSGRAHLRNIMTRNFNILRFVWGRGILYIIAGTLNVAQTWIITMASGGVMIVLGFLAIFIGIHASRKFAALRNSLADESYLLLVFSNYDSNGSGYLKPYQFAGLLSYLGMELDDRYTLKAFNAIDADGDRKISFDDFSLWWSSGYIQRGRKTIVEYEDESHMP